MKHIIKKIWQLKDRSAITSDVFILGKTYTDWGKLFIQAIRYKSGASAVKTLLQLKFLSFDI